MNPVERGVVKRFTRADTAVLLIAAGRGRRFGSDKRRAIFTADKSLLEATLDCFDPYFSSVFVALSADDSDNALAHSLQQRPVEVCRCESAQRGMGATIAEAVVACAAYPITLIALGDMPLISASVLDALVSVANPDRIVYPSFQGRRGHPVLFGRRFYEDLSCLDGDSGARDLIREAADRSMEVPVSDEGVVLDVDTLADLQRIRQTGC